MMNKVIGLVVLVALAACGGGGEATPKVVGADPNCPTEGGEVAPNPRPASTATIEVLSPEQGERIEGDSTVVKVEIDGACILEEAQTAIRPDTGHVHVSLDGKTISLLAGTEYTVTDLTEGSHTIEVEFSAADHGSFNPPVLRTVRFRVVPA